VPFFLLHCREQPVEIFHLGDVTLHSGDILADLLDRGVEFGLTAAGDEDVGAVFDEALGGGQANAAVPAGDNCNFPSRFFISAFSS
jgi:hypothetical protein